MDRLPTVITTQLANQIALDNVALLNNYKRGSLPIPSTLTTNMQTIDRARNLSVIKGGGGGLAANQT